MGKSPVLHFTQLVGPDADIDTRHPSQSEAPESHRYGSGLAAQAISRYPRVLPQEQDDEMDSLS